MSRKKRYIKLTETEVFTLREGSKNHPKPEFRERCQALLLSHSGLSIRQIASHLGYCVQSVGSWYTEWENKGIIGLRRSKGQGRIPILSIDDQEHTLALSEAVCKHYQDVKSIKAEMTLALGQEMSTDTVKRFLKKIITVGDVSAQIRTTGKTPRSIKTGRNV